MDAESQSPIERAWRQLLTVGHGNVMWGNGYDEAFVPPLRAARATPLSGLFPFTSMNRLCFSAGGVGTPIEELFLEFWPDGGGRYNVRRGDPFEASESIADTTNPVEAVALLLGQRRSE